MEPIPFFAKPLFYWHSLDGTDKNEFFILFKKSMYFFVYIYIHIGKMYFIGSIAYNVNVYST